jgi:large subunit ribosomal protein L18
MAKTNHRVAGRLRRKIRIRKKVTGTSECPRLSIFRSTKHIYAQVIDDSTGRTVATASSAKAEIEGHKGNKSAAAVVGTAIAAAAKAAGVESVVFDRNGYRYHGRVKALADAAREGGLTF